MINLSIGCNFDPIFLIEIPYLNSISDHIKITELYGSERDCHLFAARPKYRLPAITLENFELYIKSLLEIGISFNYTMNAPYLGSKREILKIERGIKEKIRFLSAIGIKTVTISNPLLAEIIRTENDSIKIAISTINHIDTVTQIKILNERYQISKVYNNILKNRNIKFLKNLQSYCTNNNIELSLIVNEFCCNTSQDLISTTHCVFRDSCYLFHSQNETKEDDALFNGYPMSNCINSRINRSSWLKSRFIRPEDLAKYSSIGIKSYKITGRTGSTEYIKTIAEAYIKEMWEGNLLSLWKPLETIFTETNELDFQHPVYIENSNLKGFIDFWFNNLEHDCANEVCGETCSYCDNFLQ